MNLFGGMTTYNPNDYIEPPLTDANGDEPEIPDEPTYGRAAFDLPARIPGPMVGWLR